MKKKGEIGKGSEKKRNVSFRTKRGSRKLQSRGETEKLTERIPVETIRVRGVRGP